DLARLPRGLPPRVHAGHDGGVAPDPAGRPGYPGVLRGTVPQRCGSTHRDVAAGRCARRCPRAPLVLEELLCVTGGPKTKRVGKEHELPTMSVRDEDPSSRCACKRIVRVGG